MIWWGGVLITSFVRTQSTIATSLAEGECYGACACASEAEFQHGCQHRDSKLDEWAKARWVDSQFHICVGGRVSSSESSRF
eukprot:6490715-Amphidinium_carterae.1